IVEAVLFSTAAGAVLGGCVGLAFGLVVPGVLVGTVAGLAAGGFAVVITFAERDGRLVIESV
ncbi:MAG: hypothetical protein ACHREM_01640, partial [Polyangiales bacterium]